MATPTTLDTHRREFGARRLVAMPLAGTLAWLAVAAAGFWGTPTMMVWTLFIATGSIVYVGPGFSQLTGERMLDKNRPKNPFDALFMLTVGEALMAWGIAIPFFMADYISLPLSVGILTGMMWLPLAWIIQHWWATSTPWRARWASSPPGPCGPRRASSPCRWSSWRSTS